jgi:iron complex outermembrane receptor protein
VTRGFKSGGFNSAATAAATAGFAPEQIWAYEAGARTEWLDRRLRVNLTGFYYNYTNLQVRQLISAGNAFITNAASATVKGLELEVNAIPTDDLRLTANFAFLQAEYNSFPRASIPGGLAAYVPNQNCVGALCTFNASGNRLDNAPRYSGMVALDYSPQVGRYELNAHVDVAWRSRAFFDASNVPLSSQEAYALVNASLGYGQDRGWRLEAYIRNLFDKGYYQTVSGNGLAPGGIVGDPRTFGLRASFDW